MGYSIWTLAAASMVIFAVASNVFPSQMAMLGVSTNWMQNPGLQRARRAPVRVAPKSTSDCLNPPFGAVASILHVYVKETFNGSTEGGVVQGRLAVGGSAELTGWSIGRAVFPQTQTCPALVEAQIYPYALTAGGPSIRMQNGQVLNGQIGVVAQTGSHQDFGKDLLASMGKYQCGVAPLEEGGPEFSFVDTQQDLMQISDRLADLDQTARVMYDVVRPIKAIIKLTGKPGDVVYMDASTLTTAHIIAVAAEPVMLTPGITVIINILGQGPFNLVGTDTSILAFANKVIWNFNEATSISFADLDWYGTILAPRAHVEAKSTRILGALYARSFAGSAEFKSPAFDGCLPLGHLVSSSSAAVKRKRRALQDDGRTVTVTKTQTVFVKETI
ncbi:hypothetical protein HDU87_007567 [Geranomyces variabilis]|uniref:Choice-of-anchor A domain-containing protein n=1 Tax=Geranomyces variabilis TaxID=109894 RepID=A0AAD5TPM0_9FUNG|nr:hypothetical protein HDU87_007567 [Geranomyces variabilis]